MTPPDEFQRLEAIAADSRYAHGANSAMVEYSFEVFSRFILPGAVLELGPAEGLMTARLGGIARRLTLVEGAAAFCDSLRTRFPKVEVVNCLFEEYRPAALFDTIVLGHVLEHVAEPVSLLSRVRGWLAPGGRAIAAVPNARSLHRQAGVLMALIPAEDALNESDRHHGHRRVYTPELFRSHFLEAGFRIEASGGYWLKPVSNRQIEESWTSEMLMAYMRLGERHPDIACELYIVAREP